MATNSYSRTHSPPRAPQGVAVGGKMLSPAQTAWTGYVVVIALYAFVFGQWQVQPVPANIHALGVLLAALCLLPLTLWVARGSRGAPAFELICLAYLLAFSSPLYLQKNLMIIDSEPSLFTWDETQRTLLLVIAGVLSFILGYYALHFSKFNIRGLQIDLPMTARKRQSFIKLAFAVGFTFVLLKTVGVRFSTGGFDTFVNQLENLVYVAIVLLGYRVLRGQESQGWRVTFYGAVMVAALLGLASGMLELALVPVLLLVIMRWSVTRRAPVALFGVGLCLFVVLSSVKMQFRSQTWGWNGSEKKTGIIEKLNLWGDLLQGAVTGTGSGPSQSSEETFRSSMSRFDLLHSFVRVQQMTPGDVPFYEGRTYSYLVYGWIPRFLWPNKPIATAASVSFAVDYGILSVAQTSSVSIGIGHLPEAYANFGLLGVIGVMALQGMFLAGINTLLNGPHSEGGRAIYLSVMVFFLNGIGSATASLFMTIPLTVIVCGLIMRCFATDWRVKEKNER